MPERKRLGPEEIDALIKQCGSVTAAAAHYGVPRTTLNRWRKSSTAKDREPGTYVQGGITLGSKRISRDKPAASLKARFFELEKGKAYPVSELARQWVRSVEIIRKHARELDCKLYVEETPENWVECIVHPDTAVKYGES